MKGLTKQTTVILLIAAAGLIVLAVRLASGSPRRELRREVSGYYQDLALQVAMVCEDLPPEAGVILLGYGFEMEVAGDRMMKPVLSRLRKEGVSVMHVESLSAEDTPGFRHGTEGFPYRDFLRVSQAYPDADAVLSLCGPPVDFVESEAGSLPALLITRVNPGRAEDVKQWIEQQWIQAAVIREGKGATPGWTLLKGSH